MPTNTINRAAINPMVSYSPSRSPPKPSNIIYFVIDLPKSKTPNSIKYNPVLTLIDRFIKLIRYYLVYKIINATQLAELLFKVFA